MPGRRYAILHLFKKEKTACSQSLFSSGRWLKDRYRRRRIEDNQIVDLYWAKSEQAVAETAHKYGKYCYSIAYNILLNAEDADESVNDAYMDAWNAMPHAEMHCD